MGGRLFQQYIVDMYAKIESSRLNYLRFNQANIRADLYQGVVVLGLRQNMRVLSCTDENARNKLEGFSKWILSIGDGKDVMTGLESDSVYFESSMIVQHETELIEKVFPCYTDETVYSSAILCSKNDAVDRLNDMIISKMSGSVLSFKSVDSVLNDNDVHLVEVEYLNKQKFAGLPLHELKVKIGCILMVLRNLDPKNGVCNGTRVKLLSATRYILTCQIVTGSYCGKIVHIPRIALVPNSTTLPCQIKRLQFPVKVAYAMTINKAQGQSLKRVGVDLTDNVFSHGQLYVAISRATNPDNLFVKLPVGSNCSSNIVYQEVFSS